MDDETIYQDSQEFWLAVQNCLICHNPADSNDVNRRLVSFVTTVAAHVKIHVNTDQDLCRCGLYLIQAPLYEENMAFCVAKELSLLAVRGLPQNVRLVLSFVLLLSCKQDASVLELIEEYSGFSVLYRSLYDMFETLAVLPDDEANEGSVGVLRQTCTAQLDTLFQMCTFLSLSADELAVIDTFFINYIFESLLPDTLEEDLLSTAKLKFILAVNEQFMIAAKDSSLENKVFETIRHHTASRNFSECLLVFFNREEDTTLQIMVSKLLYLILITPETSDLFYHNDLNVLVDVLLRGLTDLSEEEEPTRNTFLRVLYPLIKSPQFQQAPYKKEPLRQLLRYFAGQSESKFWHQTETTKRLALRCLSVQWLQEEQAQNEPPVSPSDSMSSTPRAHTLELHTNDSQTSLASISKKRPPPPLPRKSLGRTNSGQQVPHYTALR